MAAVVGSLYTLVGRRYTSRRAGAVFHRYFPPGVAPKPHVLPRPGTSTSGGLDLEQHHPTGAYCALACLERQVVLEPSRYTISEVPEYDRTLSTADCTKYNNCTVLLLTLRAWESNAARVLAAKWTADRGSQRLHLKADRLTECVSLPRPHFLPYLAER